MDEEGARPLVRQSELGGPTSGEGADLISALSDDVIILILVRLRCASSAARTGLLSRRWRGLWTRLPDLIFRDIVPGLLLVALSSFGPGAVPLSLLDIHVPAKRVSSCPRTGLRSWLSRRWPANYVSLLLHAAARLSPAMLQFNHPQKLENPYVDVDLSACFRVTTSIELHTRFLCFPAPQSELPALESLSLSGCRISLVTLVPLCPRLRVLRVADAFLGDDDIVVCSALLEEFLVENKGINSSIGLVHVEAPMLKRFTMLLRTGSDLSVSVSAPLLEKVSWRCLYSDVFVGLGVWGLLAARLVTEESNGQQGFPRVHVLWLHVFAGCPHSFPDHAEAGFPTEIKKHMFTDFSGLEVHIRTPEHVFGPFLLRLLGMHRIRTATRRLKIVLQRSKMKGRCTPLVNCPCDEPKTWRTQTISLTSLQKVEIKGFEGQDHEFDFLKLILRCARMLKKVALELSEEFTPSDDQCTKIHNIFMAFPSVECSIDHN